MSLFSRENKKKYPRFVDVHSHVSFKEYNHDRMEVMDRLRLADGKTITVGVDFTSSKQAVDTAREYAEMYATIGLHPTDTKTESFDKEKFQELAEYKEVVGVGECGLDYYRIDANDVGEKERQEKEFCTQIDFALEEDLPLMLHVRPQKGTMDAYDDVIAILKEYKEKEGEKLRGNVHFFVGDVRVMNEFITLGFTVSYTGVITFAKEYEEVVRETPLNMILVETDSPYATPVPHRGERNEPVHVQAVIKKIAAIKEMKIEEVAQEIVQNSYRVFSLD